MFNNKRQTRRRFRLGNLARLVQLRQSVSRQPQQPLPETLQEILLDSPPQSPSFHSQLLQPQSPSFQPQPLQPQSPSIQPKPQSPSFQPQPQSLSFQSQPPQPQSPSFQPQSLRPQSPSFQPQSPSFQTPPLTSVLPPPLTPAAKTPPSPPSTLNAILKPQSQNSPPLSPFKTIDETLFQSPPPPLSPKASKNLQSQPLIRSVPPPPSPPSSPKPPLHQTGLQTPTGITGKVNKNRRSAIWSEKKTLEPKMIMFINSNVQGFNTSLSLHSSSIDHDPGVHLTI